MEINTPEQQDVPIWLNDTQRWITGLTKRTTCDDVIYATLNSFGGFDEDFADRYAIVEKWRGVERPLSGRTKILKVWNFWGEEQANVQLSIRSLDDYFLPSECSLRMRHGQGHRKGSRKRSRHTAHCRCSRVRHLEKLVKRVVSQERKLQDLQDRISDMDELIDRHEHSIHERRVLQNGLDYVQRSYLKGHGSNSSGSGSADSSDVTDLSSDDFRLVFGDVSSSELAEIARVCHQIWRLDGQLSFRWGDITELTTEIERETQENDADEEDNENTRAQIEDCRTELFRLVTSHLTREHHELELDRRLAVCVNRLRTQTHELAELNIQLESFDNLVPDRAEHNSQPSNIYSSHRAPFTAKNSPSPTRLYSSLSQENLSQNGLHRGHNNAHPRPDKPRRPSSMHVTFPQTREYDTRNAESDGTGLRTHNLLTSHRVPDVVASSVLEDQGTSNVKGADNHKFTGSFITAQNSTSKGYVEDGQHTYGPCIVVKHLQSPSAEDKQESSSDLWHMLDIQDGRLRLEKRDLSKRDVDGTDNLFSTPTPELTSKSDIPTVVSRENGNFIPPPPHHHHHHNHHSMTIRDGPSIQPFPQPTHQTVRPSENTQPHRNECISDNTVLTRHAPTSHHQYHGALSQNYSKSTNGRQNLLTANGQESAGTTGQGSANIRSQMKQTTRSHAGVTSFVTGANSDKWQAAAKVRGQKPVSSNGHDVVETRGGSGTRWPPDDVFAPAVRASPEGESGNDSNAREERSKDRGPDFSHDHQFPRAGGQNCEAFANKTQSHNTNPARNPRNVYTRRTDSREDIQSRYRYGTSPTRRASQMSLAQCHENGGQPQQQSLGITHLPQGYAAAQNGIFKPNLVTSSSSSNPMRSPEVRANQPAKPQRNVRFADTPSENIPRQPVKKPALKFQTENPPALHDYSKVTAKVGQFVPYPPGFAGKTPGVGLSNGCWSFSTGHNSVDTTDSDTGLGSMQSDEQTTETLV